MMLSISKWALFTSLLCLVSLGISYGQNDREFQIYYDPVRYNTDLLDILEKSSDFKPYRLLLQMHVYPNKDLQLDKKKLSSTIQNYFPDKDSAGIICIDVENKFYNDLRNYDEGKPEFEVALEEFQKIIKIIRTMRPNLKIGYYGIPFRFYYEDPTVKNSQKIDGLIKETDIIFPSLYTFYLDKESVAKRNKEYLEKNLRVALDFGKRLNKPVIPFVWNLVHPSNKKYGGKLIPLDQFKSELSIIRNYKHEGSRVQGIVYWDPDHRSFIRMSIKYSKNPHEDPKSLQSVLFRKYLIN